MNAYGLALASILRAIESIVEASSALQAIPDPARTQDVAILERVKRRTENAAAQLELDRRLVDEVIRRELGDVDVAP